MANTNSSAAREHGFAMANKTSRPENPLVFVDQNAATDRAGYDFKSADNLPHPGGTKLIPG